jgi:hypothetical protein
LIRRSIPSLVTVLATVLAATAIFWLIDHRGPPSPLPDEPDQLVLYSIDGKPSVTKTPEEVKIAEGWPVVGHLYDYPVLGKVEVTVRRQVREVLAAVRRAIRNRPERGANCFWPRHVVRVVKGGETVDVVICVRCSRYQDYREGKSETETTQPLSSDDETLFDKILTDAGIPLAKMPWELR